MGSLQSALLGFGICRLAKIKPFDSSHHVILQTTAVAAATLPLAGGFVSIIPALEMLDVPVRLSFLQLVLWCVGIAFFGVFFAVPLRTQLILREQLRFPSGTATAEMIRVLQNHTKKTSLKHRSRNASISLGATTTDQQRSADKYQRLSPDADVPHQYNSSTNDSTNINNSIDDAIEHSANDATSEAKQWSLLLISFSVSGVFELLSYFVPVLKRIPVFGSGTAMAWGWALTPSPSYIGQVSPGLLCYVF